MDHKFPGNSTGPVKSTEGEKPLQSELEAEKYNLFPPDVDPTIPLGTTPEEQQVLEEEFTPNRPGNP